MRWCDAWPASASFSAGPATAWSTRSRAWRATRRKSLCPSQRWRHDEATLFLICCVTKCCYVRLLSLATRATRDSRFLQARSLGETLRASAPTNFLFPQVSLTPKNPPKNVFSSNLKTWLRTGPVASTWSVHFSLYLYVIMQLCLEKGKYLYAGLLTCVLLLWHTRHKKRFITMSAAWAVFFLRNHWSQR